MTTQNEHCSEFLDRLDAWLAGAYTGSEMQAHHDSCAACRREAELARAISNITSALPILTGPAIPGPSGKHRNHGLVAQLLQLWRQPLVFAPMLALILALLVLPQWRAPDTAVEPELVIIDGEEYTREEIRKAAEDLELALRYIDRYRPARVISAELEQGDSEPETRDETGDDDVPTI